MWAAVVLEEDELTTEDVLLSEVRVLDDALEEAVEEGEGREGEGRAGEERRRRRRQRRGVGGRG